ncbi:disease resistance protein RPV1 [Lactuca sativa]|uniref:disease resistance protein RPV1 n=1 Tax=Lactuca sativa TaxID=4236 RepID=UPI001C68BEAB|nr:disease resistance protein RPV1 [Lactuca sativa]
MAFSSTSSIHKSFKYDVFLSFRGEDTRKNFIDHLYSALQQKGIDTYKDDERIDKGKRISDELMGSIEDSKFFIIVLSKNYASSSWCLNELLKIMECHKTTTHIVYPVFYYVEPSEVRNQIGEFGEAFAKHENEEAAGKWRKALKEAADVAGWELKNTADGHEAKVIQQIVEKLSLELRSINVRIDENLVGMKARINNIVSSLGTAPDDVSMIGIWGIGGGGKTTLARAIFNTISFQFEGKSFIENVREVSNASLSGLKSLQKQILSDVLNDQGINVSSENEGENMMWRMMRGRKVLLVLDDVDCMEQLQALAGDPSWFKPGNTEGICLFNRYAFGREIPIQGYEELSRQVLRYAAGLPLTIKVLGSFLCGKNYKEIFLDVATILKGWPKDLVIKALESCGFHARICLRVLEQKSLITFNDKSDVGECVGMHDHIEEMGRNIVRRSHPDMPYKHSRLWIDDEIEDILANDLGTKATRCIKFYKERLNPEIVMKGLRKMKELRYLYVAQQSLYSNRAKRNPNCLNDFGLLCCNKVSPYFPDALQYLHWNNYPFGSLPKTFQANNLVALEMINSKIVQLWEGGERKALKKLRFLGLSGPKLRTFDLGLTPNLETLTLGGLGDLVELKIPLECQKLRSLKLYCAKLRPFDLWLTPNLEELFLEGGDMVEFHMPPRCLNLTSLNLKYLKLRTLDIGLTPNLENLSVMHCYDLEEIHMANECVKLRSVYLEGPKLRTVDLGPTPNLKRMDLHGSKDLEEFHIPECPILTHISMSYSKLRIIDLRLVPNLNMLFLVSCKDLVELHLADECQELESLTVMHSKLRTLDLGLTPNIKMLNLEGSYNLLELHAPIGCLKNLVRLDLSGFLGFRSFSFRLNDNTSGIVNKSLKVRPLAELHFTLKTCPFHPDNNLLKFEFTCFHKDDIPPLIRSLTKLISGGACACTKLPRFSRSIGRLRR